jgi:hypothetical protein
MSRPFEVKLPLETAYQRLVLFAVELLDAVTLARVSNGVKVVAEGLAGKATVNASGLFVWLKADIAEDIANLRKISIDPGQLPYESLEIDFADVTTPLTTVQLQPRADYAFAAGVTGLRGTLIEDRTSIPVVPVSDAEVHLRWLDDNGVWQDAPTISHTDKKRGDFVSILRLNPTEMPDIDPAGNVTVRLQARRDSNKRTSADFKLLQGRVMEPSTANTLTFAWDELQP